MLPDRFSVLPPTDQDVGRDGRPQRAGAAIARRSDEGHAGVARGGGEIAVVAGFAVEFAGSPTHRDDADARLRGGILHGREQIGQAIVVGFDQFDLGIGGHGVGPFDVERNLGRPTGVFRRRPSAHQLLDLGEAGRRQAELGIEGGQIAGDVWIVVGVDDGDRLTGTIAHHTAELDVVEAIGRGDFSRRVAQHRAGAAGQRRDFGLSRDVVQGGERIARRIDRKSAGRKQGSNLERLELSPLCPPSRHRLPEIPRVALSCRPPLTER